MWSAALTMNGIGATGKTTDAVRVPAGMIFNIMRYALHDGPGIRSTVFLKGCPLSCTWCHNPEGQSFQADLLWSAQRCRDCGDCVEACPEHGIAWRDGELRGGAQCTRCGACVEVCRTDARSMAGRCITVAELVAEIERDQLFYEESGGGATLSGGEPCAQPEFTGAVLDECHRRGIPTAIETCGFAQSRVLLGLAAKADLVLYDVKLIDAQRHRQYTGVDNALILDNLRELVARGTPLIVRIPFVPGINDRDEDLDDFARVLGSMPPSRIEVLRYHHTGMEKYRRLGVKFALEAQPSMPEEDLALVAGTLRAKGLQVHIGG